VDGAVSVSCSPASGSTFSAGTTAVVCTTKDSRNNTVTGSFNVHVSYAFSGFFQPIDNNAINAAKAGSAIPVKFSLGGNQGLNMFEIFASNPTSVAAACDSLGCRSTRLKPRLPQATACRTTLELANTSTYGRPNDPGRAAGRVTLRDDSVRTA